MIQSTNNPLISTQRIEINDEYEPENNLECSHKPTDSNIFRLFYNILKYLKVYILSTLFRRIEPSNRHLQLEENKEEDDEYINLSSEASSDIEIIAVNYKPTNDFHLINKTTRIQDNSILIDDTEETPFNIANNDSTTDLLRQLAKYRLKNRKTVTTQYGTDLTISKPIKYSSLRYQQWPVTQAETTTSTPEENFDHQPTLLDIEPITNKYQESILNYYVPTKPLSINSYSVIDNVISNFYIDKISSIYHKSHETLQQLITKERIDSQSKIKTLPSEQLNQVLKIWSTNSRQLIIENYLIEIYTHDLHTLKDSNWLNDNIIDYYFNLIMKANPNVFGWTTHFYTTLVQRGYQGVARWAKRKKINVFTMEKILTPINIGNMHWALAVIDNIKKTITYYDSLGGTHNSGNPQAVQTLAHYMTEEAKRLGVMGNEYKLIPHMEAPQQKNGSDCGVFTCTAARYISANKPLSYSQNDMKIIRRRMVYEILDNRLLD